MFIKDGQKVDPYQWITYGDYATQPVHMDPATLQKTGITVVDDPAPVVPPASAPARVFKSTVIQRLQDVGKLGAAKAALDSNVYNYARWWAPDKTFINSDDPEAIALIQAIGGDANTILAPEF